MDEKLTKTSLKQRLFIGFIAFLMLGSFAAVYIGIAVGGDGSNNSNKTNVDEAKASELLKDYTNKKADLDEAAKPLSDKYLSELSKYRSEVKAYNANAVNEGELTTSDLKNGTGDTIKDDTKYLAYYIGWCANETIFDSSFDNTDNPTSLKAPLDPSSGVIEGWTSGVNGMKIGGVRELSIPGKLAYGESQKICDATNSPLKFVVMAIPYDQSLADRIATANNAYMRYMYYANYGFDINDMNATEESDDAENDETSETEAESTEEDTNNSDNNSSTKRKTSDVFGL